MRLRVEVSSASWISDSVPPAGLALVLFPSEIFCVMFEMKHFRYMNLSDHWTVMALKLGRFPVELSKRLTGIVILLFSI